MKNYFEQLYPEVMDYLEGYQQDFLDYDRKALEGFEGRFILGLRKTGTNLLRFDGDTAPDDRISILGEPGSELNLARFDEIVRTFMFKANERFFYGNAGQVEEVSARTALALYEAAAAEGMKFHG